MKTYQKVLIGAAVFILVLGVSLQIYVSYFLDDQLKQKLTEEVHQSSDGAYSLELDELDVSLFRQNAHLSGIKIRSENQAVELDTEKLSITGIGLFRFWSRDELFIKKIDIQNPDVTFVMPEEGSGSSSGGNPEDLSSQIAKNVIGMLNSLNIPEISVSDISLKLINAPGAEPYLSFSQTNLVLHDVLVDSSTLDLKQVLPINHFETTLRDLEYKTSSGLYDIKSDVVDLSSITGSVHISGAELQPRLDKTDFFNAVGHSTDRMDMESEAIEFRGFDFDAINRQEKYEAESVKINRADIRIFHDKRYPEREDKQTQPVIQVMLQELDFALHIDTLEIEESFIRYAERVEEAEEAGEIDFNNLNASITNITNVEEQLVQNQEMVLEAEADVMDQALLSARFTFPLRERSHSIEGTVETMDASHLNRALEPLAFLRVDSGRILDLQFSMELGQQEASGDVILLYEDLKLTVISRSTNDETVITRAGTFLANTFAIKSDNSDPENPRIGEVSFERDPTKFVFNYWWKSLQSGLVSSIGL